MTASDHFKRILIEIDAFHASVAEHRDFAKAMHEKTLAGSILYHGANYSALLREALRLLQPPTAAGKTTNPEEK